MQQQAPVFEQAIGYGDAKEILEYIAREESRFEVGPQSAVGLAVAVDARAQGFARYFHAIRVRLQVEAQFARLVGGRLEVPGRYASNGYRRVAGIAGRTRDDHVAEMIREQAILGRAQTRDVVRPANEVHPEFFFAPGWAVGGGGEAGGIPEVTVGNGYRSILSVCGLGGRLRATE